MKILLLKPFLVAKTNGGEISMLERLRLIASWGHDVSIHIAVEERIKPFVVAFLNSMETPLTGTDSYQVDGIQCHLSYSADFHPTDLKAQAAMEAHFLKILELEKPELVWTHITDFFATTAAMRWNPGRSWVIVTDNEYPRLQQLENFPSLMEQYRKIKTFVAASHFMRKSLRSSFPLAKSLWVPNPVDGLASAEPLNDLSWEKKVWLFVNPTKVKGVDFAIELAKLRSSEPFLFVGNWVNESPPELPPNVSYVPRQKSLRDFWPRTKALLMPSVWDEAFGRIVLEAMQAGVPVIASDRGSLPETVGSGGVVLPLDSDLWKQTMGKPLSFWKDLKENGSLRVAQYHQNAQRRFAALRRLLQRWEAP